VGKLDNEDLSKRKRRKRFLDTLVERAELKDKSRAQKMFGRGRWSRLGNMTGGRSAGGRGGVTWQVVVREVARHRDRREGKRSTT